MADDYSVDDVALSTTPVPHGSDYSVDDVAAAAPPPTDAEKPTTLSTPAYLAGRAANAALSAGDTMNRAAVADNPFVSDADVAAANAAPPAASQFNKMAFGKPDLGAPATAVQRYGGDLAGAVGENPIAAGMFPVSTAATSLAGTAASDAGLPAWTTAAAAPFLALLAHSVKGGYNALKPSLAGESRAAAVLRGADHSGPAMAAPSDEAVAAASDAAKAAAADATEGGTSAAQAGQQIRNDLVSRQASLKGARAEATAPLAAARDASTATVDTGPVVSTINDKLRTAAGPQADALKGALSDLKTQEGEVRTQADSLAASRQAIDARISAAKRAGDDTTVKHLMDVRNTLDAQVEASVPEAAQARSTYKALSQPLDVFKAGRQSVDAVPNVVSRDNFGNLNGTPASEIPDTFLTGKATKEKLDQLVNAYGGDKTAAEAALTQHLAGKAQEALNADGTIDPAKFAQVMKPYQKVLASPSQPAEQLGMTPPTQTPAMQRLSQLGADRAAEARGERVAGAPARSFSEIAKGPAEPVAPQQWRAGNIGVFFPALKQKFANATAAAKTLGTMSAQKGVADSITRGELRDANGAVTAQSFNDWLKTNKAAITNGQGAAQLTRLQQIGSALKQMKGNDTAQEVVSTGAGYLLGGSEGGVLGHLALPGLLTKPWATRNAAAFSSAIERAVRDPAFAKSLLSRADAPGMRGAAQRYARQVVRPTRAAAIGALNEQSGELSR